MAMSDGPTYMPTSPDATVDTITFGTPTGQGAHRRRHERRTTRSAGADDPAEIGARRHESRQRL